MNFLFFYHRKTSTFILCLLFTSTFFSCRKFVEVEPRGVLGDKAVFSDSINANSAIVGIYLGIQTGSLDLLTGGVTAYTGLASDELVPFNDENLNPLYINALQVTDYYTWGYLWSNGYKGIYAANACIEGIAASTTISNSLKLKLTAEAKLLRALSYFNFINLYGEVPLITTTNYSENGSKPRTPKNLIWEQIIKDLNDAKDGLPESYVTAGRFRPNKYAALALLAKVYLYQEQWGNAESIANQIISNSASYQLTSELNDVFKPTSKEVIWQLRPIVPSIETFEGYFFIPSGTDARPTYNISGYLLNAFESGDQRKIKWLAKNTILENGIPTDYYYPFKYKLRTDNWTTEPAEGYVMFRLAEQYLIRAEARAQQGKLTGLNSAQSDLNEIRRRAGLIENTTTTKEALLAAIFQERRVELFCEWGNRWFDLKRIGKVDAVMSVVTPAKGGSWSSNWQLFPIPFEETQLNPFLTQNAGY